MGGKNAISNLQTLCKQCNTTKGVNEIDYRTKITPLRQTKSEIKLFELAGSDNIINAMARIINEFYHCGAMCELRFHERKSGQYYYTWEIVLYSGNNPKWLERCAEKLLEYIHDVLGWNHVTNIIIKN